MIMCVHPAEREDVLGNIINLDQGAYPESSIYHKNLTVEAAPTTNATCSFRLTGLINYVMCRKKCTKL